MQSPIDLIGFIIMFYVSLTIDSLVKPISNFLQVREQPEGVSLLVYSQSIERTYSISFTG